MPRRKESSDNGDTTLVGTVPERLRARPPSRKHNQEVGETNMAFGARGLGLEGSGLRLPDDIWKEILAFRGKLYIGAYRPHGCMNLGCHNTISWHWEDPWCFLCDLGNLWDDI